MASVMRFLDLLFWFAYFCENAESKQDKSAILVMSGFDNSVGTIPSNYFHTQLHQGQGSLEHEYIDFPKMQGNGAMKITYSVVQSETWGGFASINHIVNESYVVSGASEISFWYNVQTPSSAPGRIHMRLILFDGSDCTDNCAHPEGNNLETYYSFHQILDDEPGWKQVSLRLIGGDTETAPFYQTGWTGKVGNRKFDKHAIKGFKIEFSMDGDGVVGSTAAGVVLIDGLECTGHRILQALFDLDSWSSSVIAGIWWQRFYNSQTSEALTQWTYADCPVHEGFTALQGNFTIDQSETWGGFLDIGHLVPGIGYYNMSGLDEISLWYRVPKAAKPSGRAGLRLILLDSSNCTSDCTLSPGQALENYYSFHPILDEVSGWTQLKVQLQGSDSDTAPFWRTGWTGETGNRRLDKENLKGFRLELNTDGAGEVGNTITGTILFDDMSGLVSSGTEKPKQETDPTVLVFSGFDDSVGTVPTNYWYTQKHQGKGSLSHEYIASPKVQGNGAMRITYEVEQSETWGGFASLNHIANESYLLSGASKISFWYHIEVPSSATGRVHLRLILFDGSDCTDNCAHPEGNNLETYYSMHQILDDSPGWKQVKLDLVGDESDTSPFWRTGWTGITGNRKLDLDAVKGFKLEIGIDGGGEVGSKVTGAFVLDGLECTGDHILAAAFDLTAWASSLSGGLWWQRFYNSYLSGNQTRWSYEDCSVQQGNMSLNGNYTIHQSESWGGFLDIGHLLPGIAYYNMSGAEEISLWYRIPEAATPSGRAGLRLILLDSSNCTSDCFLPPGQALENYYSMQPILDTVTGWTQIKVKLEGSDADTSPFWRTGWTGQTGNRMLDKSSLKGFRLELNVDGSGDVGSTIKGAIQYDGLSGIAPAPPAVSEKDVTVLVLSSFDDSAGPLPSNYWYTQRHQGVGTCSYEYVSSPSMHGYGAMRVSYNVIQSETWGGFVSLNHIANESYLLSGAETISFWYYVEQASNATGRVHLRLILFDGSDCIGSDCAHPEGNNLETYYSFHQILDDSPGWKQISLKLEGGDSDASPFWRTGWTGKVGNRKLDLHSIRGFKLEIGIDGSGEVGSVVSGAFVLDALECSGEHVLRAPFTLNSWTSSLNSSIWYNRFYNSELSESLTSWSFMNDTQDDRLLLRGNYTIQQAETWGGFIDIGHILPGGAYYNLSSAEDIALWIRIPEAAQPTGRLGLRVILMDGSNCTGDCSLAPGQALENYYSFHQVLDTASGWMQLKVKLEGSDDETAPLWRTGWTGQTGNRVFDKAHVKGFRLEINIDGSGDVGSTVPGVIEYASMEALAKVDSAAEEDPDTTLDDYVIEPNLKFNLWGQSDSKKFSFTPTKEKCGELCARDPDCLYFAHRLPADGASCTTSSYLVDWQVELTNDQRSRRLQDQYGSFSGGWIPKHRPAACGASGVCACTHDSINCSSPGIKIMPSIDEARRANLKSIYLVGTGIPVITANLLDDLPVVETLQLGKSVGVLTSDAFAKMPALHTLSSAGAMGATINDLDQPFANVCCTPESSVQLSNSNVLSCNLHTKTVGQDCIYENFIEYDAAVSTIFKAKETTPRKGWAAASPQDCCLACQETRDCSHFTFDQRWKESESSCTLKSSGGGRLEKKRGPGDATDWRDDYSCPLSEVSQCLALPQDQLGPGYVSGFTPEERAVTGNGVGLSFSVKAIELNIQNDYTAILNITLAGPIRYGAVWVTPTSTSQAVTIDAGKLVFYNQSHRTKTFTVKGMPQVAPMQTKIKYEIEACDAAWTFLVQGDLAETHAIDVALQPDCPEDHYCPSGSSHPVPCPPGSGRLRVDPSASHLDCRCKAGLVDWRELSGEISKDFPVTPCSCKENQFLYKHECFDCGKGCAGGKECLEFWLMCDWTSPAQAWSTKFVELAATNTSSCSQSEQWTATCAAIDGTSSYLRQYATHNFPKPRAGYHFDTDDLPGGDIIVRRLTGSVSINDFNLYDDYHPTQHLFKCASEDACKEGGQCAEGREGRVCGRCKEGYYGESKKGCLQCSLLGNVISIICIVAGLLLVVCGFCQSAARAANDNAQSRQELTRLKKITAGFMTHLVICFRYIQSQGTMQTFSFDMPNLNDEFQAWVLPLSVDIDMAFGLSCLVGNSFTAATISRLSIPCILVLFVLAGSALHNAGVFIAKTFAPAAKAEDLLFVKGTDLLSIGMILFFVLYQTSLKQMVRFLECVEMPSGASVVMYRRDVVCGAPFAVVDGYEADSAWTTLFPFTIFWLLVMILGSTVVLFIFVYRPIFRGNLSAKKKFRGQIKDFRAGVFWWLLMINTREVFYVLTAFFFPANGYLQALYAAAVHTIYAVGVYAYMPYNSMYSNKLELSLESVTVCLLLLGGLSGFGQRLESDVRQQRSNLLLAVQIFGAFVVAAGMLLDFFIVFAADIKAKIFCQSDEEKVSYTSEEHKKDIRSMVMSALDVDRAGALLTSIQEMDAVSRSHLEKGLLALLSVSSSPGCPENSLFKAQLSDAKQILKKQPTLEDMREAWALALSDGKVSTASGGLEPKKSFSMETFGSEERPEYEAARNAQLNASWEYSAQDFTAGGSLEKSVYSSSRSPPKGTRRISNVSTEEMKVNGVKAWNETPTPQSPQDAKSPQIVPITPPAMTSESSSIADELGNVGSEGWTANTPKRVDKYGSSEEIEV